MTTELRCVVDRVVIFAKRKVTFATRGGSTSPAPRQFRGCVALKVGVVDHHFGDSFDFTRARIRERDVSPRVEVTLLERPVHVKVSVFPPDMKIRSTSELHLTRVRFGIDHPALHGGSVAGLERAFQATYVRKVDTHTRTETPLYHEYFEVYDVVTIVRQIRGSSGAHLERGLIRF
jgi:hypothetical protein